MNYPLLTLKNFNSKKVEKLFKNLLSHGIEMVIVGGAVRDYLLNKAISADIDIEYRLPNSKIKLLDIVNDLSDSIDHIKELKFQILKVSIGSYEIEFSPPRLETFNKEDFSHSNFEVEVDHQLSYEKSFLRRDFSINAIGLKIKRGGHFELIDPFFGLEDLDKKILKNISNQFFYDPVRLLRLIRFQLKLNFKVDKYLVGQLSKFNLTGLTVHYLQSELLKSNAGSSYINKLVKVLKKHRILINKNFLNLLNADNLKDHFKIGDQREFKYFLCYLYFINLIEKEDLIFFQVKKKEIKFFEHLKSSHDKKQLINSSNKSDFFQYLINNKINLSS